MPRRFAIDNGRLMRPSETVFESDIGWDVCQDLRQLALSLQSEVGSLRSQLSSRQATEAELNEHIATLQVPPTPPKTSNDLGLAVC